MDRAFQHPASVPCRSIQPFRSRAKKTHRAPAGDTPAVTRIRQIARGTEFDESHIAYQDLRFLLRMPDGERTGNGMGEVVSPIIIEGWTVGSWKHAVKKGQLALSATLFAPPTPEQSSEIEAAAERYGAYLNLPVTIEPLA